MSISILFTTLSNWTHKAGCHKVNMSKRIISNYNLQRLFNGVQINSEAVGGLSKYPRRNKLSDLCKLTTCFPFLMIDWALRCFHTDAH